MRAWADSSFIVALCIDDANTDKASAYFATHPEPAVISVFSQSEARHALRLGAFRGEISSQELARALARFEHDVGEGFYEMATIGSDDLFGKASQLSRRYALTHGVRFLDLLHIASALVVKSRQFLTFDARQGRLARAAGLDVRP